MSNQNDQFLMQDGFTITRQEVEHSKGNTLTEEQKEELRKRQLSSMGITEEESMQALESGLTQLHG